MEKDCEKAWTDELEECEEALPRLREGDLEKASRLYNAKKRSGMRRIPPESPLGFDKRNKWRNRGILGESGAEWQINGRNKLVRPCFS